MPFSDGGGSLQSSLPKKFLDKPSPPDAKFEDIYDQWGFTIYRTAYGGQTDVYWEALLQTIHANLRASITYYHGDKPRDGEEEAGTLLLELFRLDRRSGLHLEGKTLDELRDSYHKEPFCWSRLDPSEEKEHPVVPASFSWLTLMFLKESSSALSSSNASTWTSINEITYRTIGLFKTTAAGCR